MPSKKNSIDKSDLKRWGVLIAVGAVAGALNVIGLEIIPEMEEMGGSAMTIGVLVLTFIIDFVRRFLADTRLEAKKEVEKLVVVDTEDPPQNTDPIVVLEVKPEEHTLIDRFKRWIGG